MGSKWRALTRENIIANTDPDVKIESKVIQRNEKIKIFEEISLQELHDITNFEYQNLLLLSNIKASACSSIEFLQTIL